MSDIVPVHNSVNIFSEVILPSNEQELEVWARKNDMVNTYSTVSFGRIDHDLGRQKRRLIKALLAKEKTLDDPEVQHEIALTSAAIKAITETALSDIMKKEVCHHIITGDSPWMYASPINDTIKAVQVEEIHYEQSVQILGIEYHERSGTVMSGHNFIARPHQPIDLYRKYVEKNEKFSPLEKKLISYALDRKPYNRNQILAITQIKDIVVDRERWEIRFTWTESWDFGHVFHMFLVFLYDDVEKDVFDDTMKELYGNKSDGKHNIELLRQKLEESMWYKKFSPDFLKDEEKVRTIVLNDLSPQWLIDPH